MESFIIHGPTIMNHRSAWSKGYIYVKQGKIADVGQGLTSKQFKGVERYHLMSHRFFCLGLLTFIFTEVTGWM